METKLTICGYTVQINNMLPPGTLQVSADVAKDLKRVFEEKALRNYAELTVQDV